MMNTRQHNVAKSLVVFGLVVASMAMPVLAASLSHTAPTDAVSADVINQITTAYAHGKVAH